MKARLPQGYGKQNINELMQQAQQIQANVKQRQEELEAESYTITAGGGMITLTMTGKHQVTAVKINPDAVQPDDLEILEDLVAAAVNEAVRVVDETADAEMDKITSGLNLPGM